MADSNVARFSLYIKAGSDGICVGDCPFSQRSYMFMLKHVPAEQFKIITVNTLNKPQEFLAINPEGKVPVLVDHEKDNKVIDDSARINAYINDIYPYDDANCEYQGPGVDAVKDIFPNLAKLLKNQDLSKSSELKQALLESLTKLNAFLGENKGPKFLLCDSLSDLDCSVLPKLYHVKVAAKHYKGLDIPAGLTALHEYVNNGCQQIVWKQTCPQPEQVIFGWSRFNILKE